MTLAARQLNRATLARQLLLRRERIGVVDAVHRIVALQAQEPASPYIALWNRLDPFDPADLDAAFADQDVVKAQLMRITLHAVAADDYPAFHEAMQPSLRAARLLDRRFTSEGVSIEDTDALVPDLLAFTSAPRTNAGGRELARRALRHTEAARLVGASSVRAVRACRDRRSVGVRGPALVRRGAEPGAPR